MPQRYQFFSIDLKLADKVFLCSPRFPVPLYPNNLLTNALFMNKNLISVKRFFLTACCSLALSFGWAAVNDKPFVVPELKQWSGAEGMFAPSGKYIVKGGKQAEAVAALFANDYADLVGNRLTAKSGKPSAGDIVLVLKADKQLGAEGYRLNISDVTTITASTIEGLIWGTRTVLQLAEQNRSANYALPKGSAVDVPEYGLRGFMMDCGRKFIPMSYLRSLVKMMSYYKMNTLQIHLNDNGFRQFFGDDWAKTQAAFRLECDTYPGLTAKDGHYTKTEFVELQKLAEQYGVNIIPEIDVPAHSLAFTHYKPEIGSKEYGMDHLDLFNPETYKFVDGLLKEYLEGKSPVFRGKVVHIGTDEYSNAKKEVVEKFRYFTDHYIKYVERYGKQAAVWGALTHAKGDTKVKSQNVIMHCWYNGYAEPREMKRQGYKLVSVPDGQVYIVPAAGYYYDYLNCRNLYNTWTPAQIGEEKFDERDPSILGGMFAVWNDHAGNGITVKDIHHRLFPALQTLSTKCWTGAATSLPYDQFDRLRLRLSEAPAVNEAARWAKGKTLTIDHLRPGQTTGETEVGYGYRVEFGIEGADEAKGTPLFTSDNATFYLADPVDGCLGFEREGYLNKFKYKVEPGKKVTIAITGDNKKTCLYVDGKLREELGPLTIYAMQQKDRTSFQSTDPTAWQPVMYNPTAKMHYQRTLVFPLQKAGSFKSKITDVKVVQGM